MNDSQKSKVQLIKELNEARNRTSELEQSEKALSENEEKFKTVADFTYDWEFWIRSDYSYIYVSPAVERITGYTPQEFYDDKEILNEIIHPDDLSLYQHHMQQDIDCETKVIDFRIITRKGDIRWISHACQKVINEEGEPLGRRASNRDVTTTVLAEQEKTALRKQLMETRNMESIAQLAGGIAHDFNNALTAVLGNVELLNMRLPNDETVQKYTYPIKKSAARMTLLTSQLLAYARGGKYQSKKIMLDKFIEESISLIRHSINPVMTISLDTGCGTNQIEADSTQLQMVLSALITNSAEALETGGVIKVSTHRSEIDQSFIKAHPGAEAGL